MTTRPEQPTPGAGRSDPPDDHALWRAWVELIRRAYAHHPEYRADDRARAKHRGDVARFVSRARIEGRLRARWLTDHEGRRHLGAVAATHPEPGSWYGVPRQPLYLNRSPDDPGAIDWLVEQVLDIGLGPESDLFVFAADRELLDRLLAACPALGIDSLVLLGDVEVALRRLVEQRDPPSLTSLGFEVGPVADMTEVDRLVDLGRAVFSAHPGWCWFGTTGPHLARERAGLMQGIGGGDADDLTEVIRLDGRPVGMVQVHVDDNPLWGRIAGIGLLLHPDLWGRGLSRSIYRRFLERLRDASVVGFKGGTSQPPVMALGRLMQRPLHGAHLRVGAPFPRSHFDPYLGPAPDAEPG